MPDIDGLDTLGRRILWGLLYNTLPRRPRTISPPRWRAMVRQAQKRMWTYQRHPKYW